MKSFILLLFLIELIFAKELITLERAKELRKEVKWKVANPNTNPLKKFSYEEFKDRMKGNTRPISREIAKNLKEFLGDMDRKDIKALIEESVSIPAGARHISKKATSTTTKVDKDARRLQEEERWWEEDGQTTTETNKTPEKSVVQNEKTNTSFTPPTTIPNVDKPARWDDYYGSSLPREFDGRDVWGGCIHSGGDQGSCDGCWAFGIVNHVSDRFCIWGSDVILSAQDLLECTGGNSCCNGGTATRGYNYMMDVGVVSESCKYFTGSCNECRPTSCTRYRCQRGSMFWAESNEEAKYEIYNYGPIEGVFDVYDDFAYYGGGVYYRISNNFVGVHTVEILGWGVEDGEEYWLCKNSWGDDWGDGSFFKVKMGECGINEALTSCRPAI